MKKTLIFSVLIVVSVISFWLYALYFPIVTEDKGATYYLRPGMSKKTVITDLAQLGIVRHSLIFSLYTYTKTSTQLKTGEYLFPKGSSLVSIWRQITSGTGLVYHPFTVIPGWSFAQLRNALNQTEELRHVTAQFDDKKIMEHLGSVYTNPEGLFFPETYYYTRGIQDLVILKRAYDYMQLKLKEAWQNRALGLPYKNEYEALIAASLVEKEAYLKSERPVIAGVLVNRLRKNMLLQFDPTVIYGMGNRYTGTIHKTDLQEDTLYNTYVHKGLPPTPIAMPGMASIEAAMHPQQNDYYYFVAKGDGSHQFSQTLQEHNTAVANTVKRKQTSLNEMVIRHYMDGLIGQQLKVTD